MNLQERVKILYTVEDVKECLKLTIGLTGEELKDALLTISDAILKKTSEGHGMAQAMAHVFLREKNKVG